MHTFCRAAVFSRIVLQRAILILLVLLLWEVPMGWAQLLLPNIDIGGRTLAVMRTDYRRQLVYGLTTGGATNGAVLAFDPATRQIAKTVVVGRVPQDMDITPDGSALYVIHRDENSISRIDLDSFAVTKTLPLTPPANHPDGQHYHVLATATADIVIWVDAAWAPLGHALNFATGRELSVFQADGTYGIGGLARNAAGDRIWVWGQYGWSAGLGNSIVSRLRISGGNVSPEEVGGGDQSRDPFDVPILVSPDGKRAFYRSRGYSGTEFTGPRIEFPESLYGMTLYGDVVFSAAKAYNGRTGALISTLPVNATVQAMSADQQRLLLFDPISKRVVIHPMSEIIGVPAPGSALYPKDQSTVSAPVPSLEWGLIPIASAYDLYLGASASAVSNATPTSPEYMGRVESNAFANPQLPGVPPNPLIEGAAYYWRVDPVSLQSASKGPVWQFRLAPVSVSPQQIKTLTVQGASPQPVPLFIRRSAHSIDWKIEKSASWLTAQPASGASPADVTLSFDTSTLPAGLHETSLSLIADGQSLTIPVTLEVIPLNPSKMVADPKRPFLYAIQSSQGNPDRSFLLFINAATEKVEKVLRVGHNLTDLAVHPGEDRLYLADHGYPATPVIDLTTQSLRSFLPLHGDVYKINAGRPGRIITEGLDQWIDVGVYDTGSGAKVATFPFPQREGDGESAGGGEFYFHADNNISNASIHKYRVVNDTILPLGLSPEKPFGSRNLIVSQDGSRVFWRGFVFDSELNEQVNLKTEIYAITSRGEIAFSDKAALNAATGLELATFDASTTVLAFSEPAAKIARFQPSSGQLAFLSIASIAGLGQGVSNPQPADGASVPLPLAQLSWRSLAAAIRYDVFWGADSNAVAQATPASPLYRGSTATPAFPLSPAPILGEHRFWRVDAVGIFESVRGPVWFFQIPPIGVSTQRIDLATVFNGPLTANTVQVIAPGGLAWQATLPPESRFSLDRSQGAGDGPLTVRFNPAGLAAGNYTETLTIKSAGAVLTIPLQASVILPAVSKISAHPQQPVAYALHPGGPNGDAYLLVLNSTTAAIDKVIPVGKNATDIAVSAENGAVFVSNWGRNVTYAYLYATDELFQLDMGADVYRINAGRRGRVVIEGNDQWINVSLINSFNGATVVSAFVREGDGETSPDGNFYYHCDNNISNARITKYRIANDQFEAVASSPERPFGSRNLVLSGDGARLFWQTYAYDADLRELRSFGEQIYASSFNGRWAFAEQSVYDVETGRLAHKFPTKATAMAVDFQSRAILRFESATGRFVRTTLEEITNLPPTVANLSLSTAEDTPLIVRLSAVDPENDAVKFLVSRPPNVGDFTLDDRGALTFFPPTNFFGAATFDFAAADRWRTSSVATVTIQVTPVNDPPAALPATFTVSPGVPRAFRLTATDPESDPLSYRIVQSPTHGSLVWDEGEGRPRLTYIPAPNSPAEDRFSFVARDAQADSEPATVTFRIAAPVCLPASDGVVAWLRAEGNLDDLAGARLVQARDSIAFAPGKVGQGFLFAGATRLDLGTASSLNLKDTPTAGYSVEAWVRLDETSGTNRVLWGWASSNGSPGLRLRTHPEYPDVLQVVVPNPIAANPTPAADWVISTPRNTLQPGRFHHIATVLSRARNSITLFADGLPVASAQSPAAESLRTRGEFSVGGLPSVTNTTERSFAGIIDELFCFDRELSESEVIASFETQSAGRCPRVFPTRIAQNPVGGDFREGDPIILTVDAVGSGPLSYQWSQNGAILPGQNSPELLINNLEADSVHQFRVVVSGPGGVAESPWTAVHVVNPPAIVNGSFETGNFYGWIVQNVPQANPAFTVRKAGERPGFNFFVTAPTDGLHAATHGFDGAGPSAFELAQDLRIPKSAPELLFDYRMAWNMRDYTGSRSNRIFAVLLQPSGGGATLETWRIRTAEAKTRLLDSGPQNAAVDLSPYAGRDVRLVFSWTVPERFTGPGFVQLDNVRIVSTLPIQIRNPRFEFQPDAHTFRFLTTAGGSFLVESSTDLQLWSALGLALESSPGDYSWTDRTPNPIGRRFYRIRRQGN